MTSNRNAPNDEDLEYFDFVSQQEEPEQGQEVSRIRSLFSAPLKGLLGELSKGAEQIQGLVESLPFVGEKVEAGAIAAEASGFKPFAGEKQKQIEEALPTQDKAPERTLERGGRIAPYFALGGGAGGALSALSRITLGAIGGQTAEELGFGPLVQAFAEGISASGPDLAKAIKLKGFGGELADYAKKVGMSEEEAALALRETGPMQHFLSKFSAKGGRATRAFDKTYKALGRVWDTMKARPDAQNQLSGVESSQLINKLSKKLEKMPAEVRGKIQQDYNDLLSTNMTGENIIDFWQKSNYYINKGDSVLGVLKEPLQEALNQISPELGKDFILTNKLSSNYYKVAATMKPGVAEELIQFGEAATFLGGVVTGNLPVMAGVVGTEAGRQLALEMIKNPRLQNFSVRLINGLNRGRGAIVKQVLDLMINEVSKTNAEAAQKLSEIDVEDMMKAFE